MHCKQGFGIFLHCLALSCCICVDPSLLEGDKEGQAISFTGFFLWDLVYFMAKCHLQCGEETS